MSKQYYYPYTEWEDYQNGMYGQEVKLEQIEKCKELLSSPELLIEQMRLVINTWLVSSKQNMTGKSNNKQSWLGQSACCINHGATESETRMAWGELSDEERIEANIVADIVISEYEKQNT